MSRRTARNHWKEYPTEELIEAGGQLNMYLQSAPAVDRDELERDGRKITRALDRRRIRARQRASLKIWAEEMRKNQAEAKRRKEEKVKKNDLRAEVPQERDGSVGSGAPAD